MFLLLALFGAGVLHGLGPDHLAAIAALAGRETERSVSRREWAWLGLRFGLGHVTTLILLAGAAWALGRNLPEQWQHGLEQAGGVVLIFLGGWVVASIVRRQIVVHSHSHLHGEAATRHEHLHVHVGNQEHGAHGHPHLATLVGGLLGFSGAQALLLALPVVMAGSLTVLLARVAAFGAGIVVSMALAGWAAHLAFARLGATGYARLAVASTGALTIAVGFYWLLRFTPS